MSGEFVQTSWLHMWLQEDLLLWCQGSVWFIASILEARVFGRHCWVPTTTFDIEGNDPAMRILYFGWRRVALTCDSFYLSPFLFPRWNLASLDLRRSLQISGKDWHAANLGGACQAILFGECFVGTSYALLVVFMDWRAGVRVLWLLVGGLAARVEADIYSNLPSKRTDRVRAVGKFLQPNYRKRASPHVAQFWPFDGRRDRK